MIKLELILVVLSAVVDCNRIQVKTPLSIFNSSVRRDIGDNNFFKPHEIDTNELKAIKGATKLDQPTRMAHATPIEVSNYLKYALSSICIPEEILNFQCFCDQVLSDLHVIEDRPFSTLSVVGLDNTNKKLVISYRHELSTNTKAYLNDYRMTYMPGIPKDAGVHQGALGYHLSQQIPLEDTVLKFLSGNRFDDYEIVLTGYSMGGATALVALTDWMKFLSENSFKNKVQVVTYNSPRVGNAAWVKHIQSYNIPVTRYTRHDEVVPRLPPRSIGFVHVGVELHERASDHNLVICKQNYDEDPDCLLSEKVPKDASIRTLPYVHVIRRDPTCATRAIPEPMSK